MTDEDYQRRYDDLLEKLMEHIPESWDDDAAASHIVVEFVRELGRRVELLGGSTERHWEPPADLVEHVIQFDELGWVIQHPLACRPNLFDCPVNRVQHDDIVRTADAFGLGRFVCTLNVEGQLVVSDRVPPPTAATEQLD